MRMEYPGVNAWVVGPCTTPASAYQAYDCVSVVGSMQDLMRLSIFWSFRRPNIEATNKNGPPIHFCPKRSPRVSLASVLSRKLIFVCCSLITWPPRMRLLFPDIFLIISGTFDTRNEPVLKAYLVWVSEWVSLWFSFNICFKVKVIWVGRIYPKIWKSDLKRFNPSSSSVSNFSASSFVNS